jgi:hypothetical protein
MLKASITSTHLAINTWSVVLTHSVLHYTVLLLLLAVFIALVHLMLMLDFHNTNIGEVQKWLTRPENKSSLIFIKPAESAKVFAAIVEPRDQMIDTLLTGTLT